MDAEHEEVRKFIRSNWEDVVNAMVLGGKLFGQSGYAVLLLEKASQVGEALIDSIQRGAIRDLGQAREWDGPVVFSPWRESTCGGGFYNLL